MSTEKEKPTLLVLGAITPTPDSARSNKLEYANLSDVVAENKPFEYQRSNEFWSSDSDSLDELAAASELAKYYMLLGSHALQNAYTDNGKDLWSQRYTKAAGEIYGLPDEATAQRLWNQQVSGEEVTMNERFEKAATKVREYLDAKYSPVFDVLEENLSEQSLSPQEVADRFERGLKILAEQYDADWQEWQVDRNDEKDSLSIIGSKKKIVVGMHRANIEPGDLKALFSHEVLVHALRAMNGSKVTESLGKGLHGYLDAEEGIGVFVEYAINKTVSQKSVDRYVDIAYALGQIDGKQHSRSELLEHVVSRANRRNETALTKMQQSDIDKAAYAHVNRIFRGSLGDEHIGIYTKDIAYYKGFADMGAYIARRLEEGETIERIMDYLLSGKFDPNNSAHTAYLDAMAV